MQEKPSTEIYGFVAWVTSWVLLVMFIAWVALPSRISIKSFACTENESDCIADKLRAEVPDQHWSLAIPAFVVVLSVFIVLSYLATILTHVVPFDSRVSHKSAPSPSLLSSSITAAATTTTSVSSVVQQKAQGTIPKIEH